jgi:uncharacterized protein involved in exopolysaccharide biosynthesis
LPNPKPDGSRLVVVLKIAVAAGFFLVVVVVVVRSDEFRTWWDERKIRKP